MTSTAISAQGSTLHIGTSAGSPVNITSVNLTNPCSVGFASVSGFAKGDVVAIAGITGTTQLNGNSYVVEYVDTVAKTITLAGVDATAYTAWSAGGTATPITWTQIKNVRDFTAFDGSAAVIDVTNLSSTAKEKRMGLQDNGNFSFNMDQDNSDAGQLALRASRTAQTLKPYKLTLPNTNTATFNAYAQKISDAGAVDQVVKNSVTLVITGDVTRA